MNLIETQTKLCFQLELYTYLNDRQDCKYFYSNLLFSFQQEAGGNEAV